MILTEDFFAHYYKWNMNKDPLKILMLNPPYVDDFCRSARWAAKSRGRVQRHPDWLLIAAAVLEKENQVKFVDGAALNLKQDDIRKIIEEFNPGLTIFHTTTPSIYNDISYAKLAKEHSSSITVMVGPHVSVEFENTFEIAKGAVDIIVRGEYDCTLEDIASLLHESNGNANGKFSQGLSKIDGVSFQRQDSGNSNGGTVCNTPDRSLVNVNDLPFPAWHFIRPEWYNDAGKRSPFITLISGRGCFGQCTFCRDTPIMYGRKLRFRDPKLVVEEIEYDLALFPNLKEIMFETDSFTAFPEHVRGVCEEILRKKIRISWNCNTRVDMDLSLLPLMKKAGCRMLMTGFEFGVQSSLDAIKKGTTLEQAREFSREAKKHGFTIHGCFMIGAPDETHSTARATIEFSKSLPLDTVQFSGVCAYPGTEIYQWAKTNNFLIPKDWKEWISKDHEQVTLLDYPQLSKKEIDELIDEGLRSFYLRPRQIFKMACDIRGWEDLKRKIFGFKSFLDYIFKSRGHFKSNSIPQ